MRLRVVLIAFLTTSTFVYAQAVSVKSYNQLLAEDRTGLMAQDDGLRAVQNAARAATGVSYFALSLVNGLSFPPSDYEVNVLRLNLVSGLHHSVHGLDVSGLASFTQYDCTGIVLGGIYSEVGDTMVGVQIAPINRAHRLSGVQAGVLNFTESGSGLQIGLYNHAKAFYGLQLGLLNFNGASSASYLPLLNCAF